MHTSCLYLLLIFHLAFPVHNLGINRSVCMALKFVDPWPDEAHSHRSTSRIFSSSGRLAIFLALVSTTFQLPINSKVSVVVWWTPKSYKLICLIDLQENISVGWGTCSLVSVTVPCQHQSPIKNSPQEPKKKENTMTMRPTWSDLKGSWSHINLLLYVPG